MANQLKPVKVNLQWLATV